MSETRLHDRNHVQAASVTASPSTSMRRDYIMFFELLQTKNLPYIY